MGKKKVKRSFGIGWILVLAMITVGAAGSVAYYMNSKTAKVDIRPHSSKPVVEVQQRVPEKPKPVERKVVVYVPKTTQDSFYLVPVTRTTDRKGDILDVAVATLIDTNKESGDAGALIPKGTKSLSQIKVSKGVATVNFNNEFISNFRGGSSQEALVLNSIAQTLVDNSDGKVQKVLILVEGKTVDTLGGHFELDEPMSPDPAMLKPGS